MKLRRPTSLSVLMSAVAIVAAAALLSATVAPQHYAFADKGGNGNGNNGNGNGNGGGNGANGNGHGSGGNSSGGNGNGNSGGNGNGNSGGNGNGNGNGNANGQGNGTNGNGNGFGLGNGNGLAKGRIADEAAPDEAGIADTVSPPGSTPPANGKVKGRDRIIRNEIVVTDPSASLSAFVRARGFQVVRSETLGALGLNVTRMQVPEGISAAQARDLIAGQFPDAVVDYNHLYQPQTSLSLPSADYAEKAVRWSTGLRDCSVAARLGLIDTEVDWSLPILSGAHKEAASFLGDGIAPAPAQHGTGIATLLVGQKGFGLLPGAALYSAGIFGVDSTGEPVASATSFASALNWLLTNNVATINVSLSGPPDRLMELAVKHAQHRGAELVAAVGNDGATDVPRFPAAYAGVIGVTAVDQAGHVFDGANRGNFVALAAPGVDLLIPGQPNAGGAGDRLVTGTSFAVPYVTAALASYGNDPKRMYAGAVDLGAPGPDPIFGRGLVQGPNVCLSAASAN